MYHTKDGLQLHLKIKKYKPPENYIKPLIYHRLAYHHTGCQSPMQVHFL